MIFGKDEIRRLNVIRDGSIDANGDYKAPSTRYGVALPCDARPATEKAQATIFQDGKRLDYSWEVTLELGEVFEIGDQVRLISHGHTTIGHVLSYQEYSTFAKLWL